MSARWEVERARGRAGELHRESAEWVAGATGRAVRVLEALEPALVLGSAQPDGDVDRLAAAEAGVDVVHRRSGGSAVLVGPGECLWVDVVVPAGDPLWDDDVGRAAWWLGECWRRALDAAGVPGPWHVHRGGLTATPWSSRVCFAGTGPGEVTVGAGGPKVVGLAQRRVRAATLFQTAALLRWDPVGLAGLLAVPEPDRPSVAGDLAPVARGIGADAAGPLLDALLDQLEGPEVVPPAPAA